MSDLIDRQAAIEALGEEPEVWNDDETEIAERNQWRMDIDAIKAVPSAEPEIIRCKNCKWFYKYTWCVRYLKVFLPEDFCSYAERRTDGKDN